MKYTFHTITLFSLIFPFFSLHAQTEEPLLIYFESFEQSSLNIFYPSLSTKSTYLQAGDDTYTPVCQAAHGSSVLLFGEKDKESNQRFRSNYMDLTQYESVSLDFRYGACGLGVDGMDKSDFLLVSFGSRVNGYEKLKEVFRVEGYWNARWTVDQPNMVTYSYADAIQKLPVYSPTINNDRVNYISRCVITDLPVDKLSYFRFQLSANSKSEFWMVDDIRVYAHRPATWGKYSPDMLAAPPQRDPRFLEIKGHWTQADIDQLQQLIQSDISLLEQVEMRNATFEEDVLLEDLFVGAKELLAVYAKALPSSFSHAFSQVNPNCLIYLPSESVASGINVLSGNRVEHLVLQDAYPYCLQFDAHAGHIEYKRFFSPDKQSGMNRAAGWETIVFPFKPKYVYAKDKGNAQLKPFSPTGSFDYDNYRPFWLRRLRNDVFEPTDFMDFYTPYIICMPNHKEYQDKFNISGEVIFEATEQKLFPTHFMSAYRGKKLDLNPTLLTVKRNPSNYTLDDLGEAFEADRDDAEPFSAYLKSASELVDLPRRIDLNEPGGIMTSIAESLPKKSKSYRWELMPGAIRIVAKEKISIRIHSLEGILINHHQLRPGEEVIQPLQQGYYLINNDKIFIPYTL